MLAELIRSRPGWTASVEAAPADGDEGGWRADVLANGPEGRRVAIEVQLASMTAALGKQRGALYDRDGVEHVWLTPTNPQWVLKIPTLGFSSLKPLTDSGLQEMRVMRGLYRLSKHGYLEPRGGNPPLDGVLLGLLAGKFETCAIERAGGVRMVIAPTADVAAATIHATSRVDDPMPEEHAPGSVAEAGRGSGSRLGGDIDGALHRARQRFVSAAAARGQLAIDDRKMGRAYLEAAAALIALMQLEAERYAQWVEQAASMPADWARKEIRAGLTNRDITQHYRVQLAAARKQLATAHEHLEAVRVQDTD
jgi:hypothetical protein